MAQFPTTIPAFQDLNPATSLAANNHAARHNTIHAELAAAIAKIGINNSLDTSSLDYKVAQNTSAIAGHTSQLQTQAAQLAGYSSVMATLADNQTFTNKLISTGSRIDENVNVIEVLKKVYPVGSTYINYGNSANPNTLFGFGSWVAIPGRFLIGIDATQAEFDTINETGGAKTHTLAMSEIPNATGDIVLHGGENSTNIAGWGGVFGVPEVYGGGYKAPPGTTGGANSARYGFNFNLGGGGQAHNNMPPFLVVYMWRRTA